MKPASSDSSDRPYPYDAIIVLGGGLHLRDGEYYPADYSDSDEFGVLGGHMRLQAALEFFAAAKPKNVVFTTGVYQKHITKFGPDVPPEADVYAKRFLETLAKLKSDPAYAAMLKDAGNPRVTLENGSTTTMTNIRETLRIIREKKWGRVAIITNDYHVPRVKALFEKMRTNPDNATTVEIEFLSAERIVRQFRPGVYDAEIDEAYRSPEAQKRIMNEQNGIKDLAAGRYADGEFQLEK